MNDWSEEELFDDCGRELFRFLAIFSRFEYAMKEAGYFRRDYKRSKRPTASSSAAPEDSDLACEAGNVCRIAEPAWQRFVNELASDLSPSDLARVNQAAGEMLMKPPRRNVWKGGDQLEWEDLSGRHATGQDVSLEFIRLCVATVRNNLFHGGKYADERERTLMLVRHSTEVLLALTELHPTVGRYFRGR